jgi:hypothetical protein
MVTDMIEERKMAFSMSSLEAEEQFLHPLKVEEDISIVSGSLFRRRR